MPAKLTGYRRHGACVVLVGLPRPLRVSREPEGLLLLTPLRRRSVNGMDSLARRQPTIACVQERRPSDGNSGRESGQLGCERC
jgi:hypothetical protein